MRHETIGFALCGSFCTLERSFHALEGLRERFAHVIPIVSEATAAEDTRFGNAQEHLRRLERICGRSVLRTQQEVEPIGPKGLLDALVICPCTGNTLAKLSHGISDGAVTLAAKAHLRNGRPLSLIHI